MTNKFHRFLFLFALSNGMVYMQMFDTLTGRIFTAFGLLLLIMREIKFRSLNKDLTSTKFVFTQMMILMFTFGVTPQYIFLVFIYLFHNIKFKDFFKKDQIRRYFYLIAAFMIQNFMLIIIFIIDPEAILNLLGGHWRGDISSGISPNVLTYEYRLKYRPRDPVSSISIMIFVLSIYYNLSGMPISFLIISLVIMTTITIIIILKKELTIEKRFGLWALSSLFFYTFTENRYFVGLLPLIVILFLDYKISQDKSIIKFVKNNYLILFGLVL